MHLKIVADDGAVVGELEARDGPKMWMDLLMYVSHRWEAQAVLATASALVAIIAGHDPG